MGLGALTGKVESHDRIGAGKSVIMENGGPRVHRVREQRETGGF